MIIPNAESCLPKSNHHECALRTMNCVAILPMIACELASPYMNVFFPQASTAQTECAQIAAWSKLEAKKINKNPRYVRGLVIQFVSLIAAIIQRLFITTSPFITGRVSEDTRKPPIWFTSTPEARLWTTREQRRRIFSGGSSPSLCYFSNH